jgi:hypothetical protein
MKHAAGAWASGHRDWHRGEPSFVYRDENPMPGKRLDMGALDPVEIPYAGAGGIGSLGWAPRGRSPA